MNSTKILTNFLLHTPVKLNLWKNGIPIAELRLQTISHGLFQNLRQSCNSYIEGLIDMDAQFLKNTTSPYLYKKIQNQIKQLKQQQKNQSSPQNLFAKAVNITPSHINQNPDAQYPKILKRCIISPYVIFGSTVTQRINNHPLQNVLQLTRNRYFKLKDPQNNLYNTIINIKNQQVYGFKCQIITNTNKIVVVTLEGDIDNNQYHVVDLNNLLFSQTNLQ